MAADDLRRQCDEFIDISTLKVKRDPTERAVRDMGVERTIRAIGSNPAIEQRYGIKTDGKSSDLDS